MNLFIATAFIPFMLGVKLNYMPYIGIKLVEALIVIVLAIGYQNKNSINYTVYYDKKAS